ncbi:aminotransferase class IV [Celeribacter sp.]|uniref:aminotransferase class IV n=1 Tax=Celeribacter sp. TaxID=1890673 RepID=UPI003A935880
MTLDFAGDERLQTAFAEAWSRKADFKEGAAYMRGRFVPLSEATIPITDWAYRRSDVVYDVASVWEGSFFRLDDHIARFRRSMTRWRLDPPESDAQIHDVALAVVALSGLKAAYVGMDCLRGKAPRGVASHPANAQNYLAVFARGFAWIMPPDLQERGARMMIAKTRRIAPEAVDPTAKNFHWGDMTQALFEAEDQGLDGAILLDADGYVTEGPGYNVFAVLAGTVVTPDRGALEGMTRQSVLELCAMLNIPTEVRPISVQELEHCDEIFMTTTAGGVMPASELDGRALASTIGRQLRHRYWAEREAGWLGTPVDYERSCDGGTD